MTDIESVMGVIQKINEHCKEIDEFKTSKSEEYRKEKESVEKASSGLLAEMQTKYEAFKATHFLNVKGQINQLVELLAQDYAGEVNRITVEHDDYKTVSYEVCEERLYVLVEKINEYTQKLNAVDFDKLVPPVKLELLGEKFVTYTGDKENMKEFDCNTTTRSKILDPKPVRSIVQELLPYCKEAQMCIDSMVELYDKKFNLDGFSAYVKSSAQACMSEFEAKLRGDYNKLFDEMFIDEKAKAIPKSFFINLENEGMASNVDLKAGTDTYNESLTIGDIKLLVEDNPDHLAYIKNSPVLSRYLSDGYLAAPCILNLRECGNIFLNIDEESYAEDTVAFVNQLIIQFLLSFPANRINLCLIDIDNKMGFSQFKSLTKINNNILFNGIIRDDRQLDNTIKDMEQAMYKIDDDLLSYNNVQDIYEYNQRFEANPQNVHLFVLVDYPAGMREDTAKRVMKILQGGNRAGIFSIIINNHACALPSGYKPEEYAQFVENAEKASNVINKTGSKFSLGKGTSNFFVPKKEVSISSLADIVEMLKENAESNRQKVVRLEAIFEDTDRIMNSSKKIPSSAEVLDIPIGARGGDTQNILLKTTGDGSAHAVVIGGTGSGKSNLLHTIILSACYKYSPEELNLYLVDFKGGVEFKYYEANKVKEHQLPHIKLTGLTSDLEDGVAILNNLHKELRRREDSFRKCGVEDIVQYRNLGYRMPRLFVIIDEIQELFEQDESLGQKAINILRELFKKGRAFGINILWASQNIPSAAGLRDKVLSQIGNRISLRLNEPEDARDIMIDPKVVRNLNRPEKGLGVINDIRYGNESVEFRVAYAESSENRQKYSQEIIEKWKAVTDASEQEPLFIVGDDDEPSPVLGNTIYTVVPKKEYIVSKAFDSYVVQLGQDYVTGKPYSIELPLRENKMNMLLAGYDVEMLRDMMGYSLLSIVLNHMTNADCISEETKIYYANGEMINPKNSDDLYNVIRKDFGHVVENVSSNENMISCIKAMYKLYKERSLDSDNSEYAKIYPPCFFVIHSMQRYMDLFNENPRLKLQGEEESVDQSNSKDIQMNKLGGALDFFTKAQEISLTAPSISAGKSAGTDEVFFSDAVKELLDRGGAYGIHFIISMDNPYGISALNNVFPEIMYKIFVKGVNANAMSQMIGNYKLSNSLNNPRVAMVFMQDEYVKVQAYRYSPEQDETWYKNLCANYNKFWEDNQ